LHFRAGFSRFLALLCIVICPIVHLANPSLVAPLRRLAASGWGAGATTRRTAILALAHSTAEYSAPVWCRSAHTNLIGPAIDDALLIVTGCLRLTPADNLPILAGFQPAELRSNGAALFLVRPVMAP